MLRQARAKLEDLKVTQAETQKKNKQNLADLETAILNKNLETQQVKFELSEKEEYILKLQKQILSVKTLN